MQEYWEWPEDVWRDPSIDLKNAKEIIGGIDIGTTSTQAVLMSDGKLCSYVNLHSCADFDKGAERAYAALLKEAGISGEKIAKFGCTGWGRTHAAFADQAFDEIHCHAKGARFMYGPEIHTVVDLGGQSVKAIRLYDWDRVWDFTMNDKCATGFGRSIEELCELLEVPLEEIGALSLDVANDPEPVSTTCYAFANTETMGLFRPGFREDPMTANEVYASALFAVAWRTLGTIGKLQPLDVGDIKVYEKLAFTGGMAKNVGITKRIERELRTEALTSRYDPMLAGAIGAALLSVDG